jgi:hypothetical protein
MLKANAVKNPPFAAEEVFVSEIMIFVVLFRASVEKLKRPLKDPRPSNPLLPENSICEANEVTAVVVKIKIAIKIFFFILSTPMPFRFQIFSLERIRPDRPRLVGKKLWRFFLKP